MTDRELLEKAARAAGLRAIVDGDRLANPHPILEEKPGTTWNPLDDDGDAFRLAVSLNMAFRCIGHKVIAVKGGVVVEEYVRDEEMLATRRAIVRAAAAMADDQ